MRMSEIRQDLRYLHKDLEPTEINHLTNKLLNKLSEVLINKQRIEIRGFGTFCIKSIRKKEVRNPKENTIISGNYTLDSVYFRPGKELRDRVKQACSTEM